MSTLRLALVVVMAATMAAACKPPQPSPEYLATCEGPPVRTAEQREKAMQEGYEIDPYHHCITKRSAQAIAEQKAQWEAANTPEAKAARQAELEQRAAETKVLIEARAKEAAKEEADARAERERLWAEVQAVPQAVEINTASESQLASMPGLGSHVAQQIVAERAKGRFADWADVVHRVVGLSAAETAVRASSFGLTVNGRSLEGAEPDSVMAKSMRFKWRSRNG